VDWLAGLLCGLAFVMRYAAIFLAIYAVLVIVLQSGSNLKKVLSRIGAFALGLLPFVVPQTYFSLFSSAPEPIPDIVTLQGGARAALERLAQGWPFLASANVAVAWWMPDRFLNLLTQPATQAPWLICLTLIVWASLPILLARKIECRDLKTASRDVRTVAAGFLVALPLFLLAWTGFADYLYVFEPRYYLPLIPLLILIAYQLATPAARQESRFGKWLGKASLLYLVAFLFAATISALRLVIPGSAGVNSRIRLMAVPPQRFHWPSSKSGYDFSPSRAYVVNQLRENPGTVLVTNHEEWFYAEADLDQARIRRLKDLRATYVSGPARILIVIQDHSPGDITSVAWVGHYDKRWTADYFQNLTDVRLLRTFPDEEIRVVEARVAEGERVRLKTDAAQRDL